MWTLTMTWTHRGGVACPVLEGAPLVRVKDAHSPVLASGGELGTVGGELGHEHGPLKETVHVARARDGATPAPHAPSKAAVEGRRETGPRAAQETAARASRNREHQADETKTLHF